MEKTASLEELIKREYRTMVCTMPFGEITVSELCKRVGVSRKSFYTYFESRDDVLARILYDDIGAPIEKIFPLFRNQNAPVSVPIMNTMVYQAILDHKEFYQRLVTQNQERIFVHAFQKCLMVSHALPTTPWAARRARSSSTPRVFWRRPRRPSSCSGSARAWRSRPSSSASGSAPGRLRRCSR